MRNTSILSVAVLAALALPAAALAQTAQTKATVDSAKAAGIVGEQADGFLGLVTSAADPAVKATVADINAGRAQLYAQAAAKNGVTPVAAGAAAFESVVRGKLRPGDYYRPAGGGWVRK
ncbi:YdbL family protein [Phenylobacterium sp.]|uniref:YdbL family protein n=1 Tax=Phenylobacterium sp. TaxID=1871053 RepID=UPI00286B311C|nr:YdbL family protein [Phenylobacterium sp.]